jgi:hypothetical protein
VAAQVQRNPEHVGAGDEGEEGEDESRIDEICPQSLRIHRRPQQEREQHQRVDGERDDQQRGGERLVTKQKEAVGHDPRRHHDVEVAGVKRRDRAVKHRSTMTRSPDVSQMRARPGGLDRRGCYARTLNGRHGV